MSTETQTKTKTIKSIREVELVHSDRLALMDEANVFIANMVYKQVVPISNGSMASIDFTDEETRTYNAALGYLERQFTAGFRETEVYDKKSEREESV